ncbi:LemA protein [Metamycoplasma subdolum]|uniref:LemA protein n=1 Tax=Metamycoplasma subdolum TaxID=92407 RepID=A0A3M0A243_9BACT|nr:LemA family protein [Metamycoplasma subdolum]RMA79053.1 LemA protein [Metamycoplasma subdolum]WPB50577.1 LemA family protein [Metamycoplasma subdolum]
MLIDTRKEQAKKGFNPNVDNEAIPAKASGLDWFWYILISIFTLGIFWLATWFRTKNELNQKQMVVNEASSNIQVALKKRRGILVKLIDTVKGYAQHEKGTLTEVIKYRSRIVELENVQDNNKLEQELGKINSGINVLIENYPTLKADRTYLQLMSEISLIEDEIASAARIYNSRVRSFNAQIFTWYSSIVAQKNRLYTLPHFQASEEEMKDVDTSSLVS